MCLIFSLTVFPAVFSSKFIQHEIVGNYSHLFTVQGSNPEMMPYMLLAHMDVVPASPEGWEFPPFSAAEHEGFIYGRGTLDNKNSAIVRRLGNIISERCKAWKRQIGGISSLESYYIVSLAPL